jgi:hypothetical protein
MELRKTIKNQNAEAGAAQVSWPDWIAEVFVERFVDPPRSNVERLLRSRLS